VYGAEPHTIELLVNGKHRSNGAIDLTFELHYMGKKPATVYESDLPWGIHDSLLLVSVCMDGLKTLVPQVDFFDDPTPNQVSIQSGEVLSGSIDLARRFPNLR
jgi:hypothetical protein